MPSAMLSFFPPLWKPQTARIKSLLQSFGTALEHAKYGGFCGTDDDSENGQQRGALVQCLLGRKGRLDLDLHPSLLPSKFLAIDER